jgi:uncharacterized protein YkwD
MSKNKSKRRFPAFWVGWTALILLLSGCGQLVEFLPRLPGLDAPVAEPPDPRVAAQSPAIAEMEAEIRQRINEIRQQHGLNELQNNERLAQVARDYSQTMARKNFFSHTGRDGSTPAQRVRAGGINYLLVGENLFRGRNIPNPVSVSVKGWMNSPGHRENILRPVFNQTGIGIWRQGNTYYITQLFLRSLF